MSIVQSDLKVDGVLTTDPVAQLIADPNIMTRYLRQLNRRNSRESVGHNHSVIWNISQRFAQLQIGQNITVRVSYFEGTRLNSGVYEISSLGIFPPAKSTPTVLENHLQDQSHRMPQAVIDTIATLVGRVETLQQQLHTVQENTQNHEIRLKAMEEQIRYLEAENHALKETQNVQATPHPSTCPHQRDVPSSPSPPPHETTDEDRVITDARSLFQQFVKASTPSRSSRETSANYSLKNRRQRKI
ncbi:MAG: hypothetical protein O7E52_27800 [Candidatus Poribacteria bacterium]|nr:hypothetical protein [Candidatus Poribacteria bacterium]